MQIRNMNKYIEQARIQLKEKNGISDADHYFKTLDSATIKEDEYFSNLLSNDIKQISMSIKTC